VSPVSVEKYISSLGGDSSDGEGHFTLSAKRAQELLSEKVLTDTWQAWLCLMQGIYDSKAQGLDIQVQRRGVVIQAKFQTPMTLKELLAHERFLLAWLNLDWFGEAVWEENKQTLQVTWSGSILKRYRMASSLKGLLSSQLRFAACPTEINGKRKTRIESAAKKFTLFSTNKDRSGPNSSLFLPNLYPLQSRYVHLDDGDEKQGPHFSAIAYKTGKSWSQVRWISHGVIIKEERNTLERPGLFVAASVENLGLNTDLSGFSVIHDEAYFRFVNRLKKEVLWML
jgi:hypothetical protein